jgi:uncharacterized membrane protein YkoI
MYRYTKIGLIAITLAATGIAAYASKTLENDATLLAAAKVSMSQAVTTAEQHAGGRATRAELEQTKTGLAYDVEVVSGSKVFDVRVDPDKGTVMSSAQDAVDHDDGQDKQD